MEEEARTSTGHPWQQSIYEQLHQVAERALARERPGHSLQPTLLVNDAYMRLVEQRNVDPADRAQVLAAGATIIRRLLVDYARKRKAEKRGGEAGRGGEISVNVELAGSADTVDVVELSDALDQLSRQSERAAQVVELKFFGGLTGEEIAEQLNASLRTVNNDWRFAKAWLYKVLDDDSLGPGN